MEWALDSVGTEQTLWLPQEDQLRRLLGGTFRRLERAGAAADGGVGRRHRPARRGASEQADRAATAVEAYGRALLRLLERALG